MSAPRKPTGGAIDQHTNGWGMQCIVGSFEAKLLPLFLLVRVTMEGSSSNMVPTALPMSIELAYALDGLREEWEAFADVLRKETGA